MAAVAGDLARHLAADPGVRAAVTAETERIADRARGLLAGHRRTGHARIEVQRDGLDGLVSLVDPAAVSIEYGRAAYTRDGRRVGAAPGLYVLTRAARL